VLQAQGVVTITGNRQDRIIDELVAGHNTFAAGVYTTRLFYAVGNVLTNMTILP
jgi:hypothetical protein